VSKSFASLERGVGSDVPVRIDGFHGVEKRPPDRTVVAMEQNEGSEVEIR